MLSKNNLQMNVCCNAQLGVKDGFLLIVPTV